MSLWTLSYEGETRTLAGWGLGGVRRRLRSQARDTVSLRAEGEALEAEPLFAAEAVVRIHRADTLWFSGVVVARPRAGNTAGERGGYLVAGPWWHLENLVYQQGWMEAVDVNDPQSALAPVERGHVILGQDASGNPMSAGEQVRALIDYAAARGAPLQAGTVELGAARPPYDEARDLSCAECIQRLLRWFPDAVTWVDYGAPGGPALNVVRRAELGARSVAAGIEGVDTVRRLEVTPREDLRRPAVVIKYEKTHQSDGRTWTTTETDAWPAGATGGELKALVMTVELDGLRASYARQEVETDPISETNAQWWREKTPALQGVPLSQITVHGASRTSSLPKELVSGNIAPWMNQEAEADTIRATVSWYSEDEYVVERELAVRLTATDAATRTYRRLLASTPAEPTPAGLAQALGEALEEPQYAGEVELEAAEAGGGAWLGRVLNVAGLRGEWASMRAVVQAVDEDLERGRTSIRFGPAGHLGADDMVELLRANRRRRASGAHVMRLSGEPDSASPQEGGRHARLESTSSGPGRYRKLTFVDPEEPLRRVVIDAAALPRDLTVSLRVEDVCENGLLKKRLVLASEAYEEDA